MSSAVDVFPLDDDDILTDLDSQPFRGGSYIGPLPFEDDLQARLRADLVDLTAAVVAVEQTCAEFDVTDPSAEAAEVALRKCVGRISVLGSALRNVCAFVASASHRELFVPETGLLEPYLTSVRMWARDVAETLGRLATDLNTLVPDWETFRGSLDDVSWVYARAAEEQSRLAGVAETLPPDIRAALGELFVALRALKRSVDAPFG